MALVSPALAWAQDDSRLVELMQGLAQVKSARGKFVERKYLAMLESPLESSGTLAYSAPARLEKHMLAPRQESMIVDGDNLLFKEPDLRDPAKAPIFKELWQLNDPVLRTLARFIRSEVKAGVAPDLVVISGDLAFSGRAEEYALARAWLDDQLWPALPGDLPRDRLLLVPGNHDVDRSKVSRDARAIQNELLDVVSV